MQPKLKAHCNKVIFWPQYGPTCWFNSVLISVFYGQHSRNLLYQISSKWDKSIEFYKMLRFVLKHKYLKSKKPEKDFHFFDIMKPENILQMIHRINGKYATENMGSHGAWEQLLIGKMYKLLGASYLMFENIGNDLYYDRRNHVILRPQTSTENFTYLMKPKKPSYIANKINKNKTPDVLLLNVSASDMYKNFYNSYQQYKIPITNDNIELLSMADNIKYNGQEYVLDSVILANWNKGKKTTDARNPNPTIRGHVIVGLTCNNKRYVYNGWTRLTRDPSKTGNNTRLVPCELMKYHWNFKKGKEFVINASNCTLPKASQYAKNNKACFSFTKGDRLLIYIKKDYVSKKQNIQDTPEYKSYQSYNSSDSNIKPRKTPECKQNEIRNPASNRCINKTTAVLKNLVKPDCPPGKYRHPVTNRCRKVPDTISYSPPKPKKTTKQLKNCPPGKLRNPLTGRCKTVIYN